MTFRQTDLFGPRDPVPGGAVLLWMGERGVVRRWTFRHGSRCALIRFPGGRLHSVTTSQLMQAMSEGRARVLDDDQATAWERWTPQIGDAVAERGHRRDGPWGRVEEVAVGLGRVKLEANGGTWWAQLEDVDPYDIPAPPGPRPFTQAPLTDWLNAHGEE